MFRRCVAAVALALVVGAGVAACDGKGDAKGPQAPAGTMREDPTLTDDADEGSPPNSATDSGSGTGSGRGTP